MQEGEKNLENLGLSLEFSRKRGNGGIGIHKGPALFYLDLSSVSRGTKRKNNQSRISFEMPLCYEL